MISNREKIKVFVNQHSGVVTRSIFDLADVDLADAANNEILTYDAATNTIVPADASTILSISGDDNVIDGGSY